MLHLRGGGSHDGQAGAAPPGVSLAGLFVTNHCWRALATFPLERIQRFSQRLLNEYGLAQVGFSYVRAKLHRFEHLT
jgi:hypothetical protein